MKQVEFEQLYAHSTGWVMKDKKIGATSNYD